MTTLAAFSPSAYRRLSVVVAGAVLLGIMADDRPASADWTPYSQIGVFTGLIYPTPLAGCQASLATHAPSYSWTFTGPSRVPPGGFGYGGYSCVYTGVNPTTGAKASDSVLYIPVCGPPAVVTGTADYTYSYPSGCQPLNPAVGKQLGCNKCSTTGAATVGDPVDLASGNVFYEKTDYASAGPNRLVFTRYYNSLGRSIQPTALGTGWRGSYDRYLSAVSASSVTAERPDGKQITFTQSGGAWVTDTDVDYRLTNSGATYTLVGPDDSIETYSLAASPTTALLSSIRTRNGYTQTVSRATNRITVTDSYGRTLTLNLNGSGLLASLITADGTTILYGYDVSGFVQGTTPDRLASVTYPDAPSTPVRYGYSALTDGGGRPASPFWLTKITDENGNAQVQWAYDVYGRGTSSQGYSGLNLTAISYNDTTGARTVTNALGLAETYLFTTLQGVPKVTTINRAATPTTQAASRIIAYDAAGFLASVTDWLGNKTVFVNDSRGLPTSITEASGTGFARATSIAYITTTATAPYPPGYRYHLPATLQEGIAGTSPALGTTAFSYDVAGNILSRAISDGSGQNQPARTWKATYNGTGQVLTTTTPRGFTTTYTYATTSSQPAAVAFIQVVALPTAASTEQLLSITDPLGHISKFSNFTGSGLPQVVTDMNGVTRGIAYNARQHIIDTSVVTSSVHLDTHYFWTGNDEPYYTLWPDGTSLANNYNYESSAVNGPQFSYSNTAGDQFYYYLDALGNPLTTVSFDKVGNMSFYRNATFDARGLKISDTSFDRTKTYTITRDANGNAVTVVDPLGHVTTRTFDLFNRLISTLDANGGTTSVQYDALDNVISLTDPNGNTTSFVRDGFGDLIRETSPDHGVTVRAYDLDGNIVSKTDGTGNVATYTYDALDRIKTVTIPTTPGLPDLGATFVFDESGHGYGVGHLTTISDRPGTVSRFYDERGSLTKEVRSIAGVSFTTSYQYNGANRLVGMTYPSGAVVSYARDNTGRVTSMGFTAAGADSTSVLSSVKWLPFGPAAAVTFNDGIAETRGYDHDLNMTSLSAGSTGGINLGYQFTDAGNLATITDGFVPSNSQTLVYDPIDRLIGATAGSGGYGSLSWNYDRNGNPTSFTSGGVSYTAALAPGTNRVASVTGGGHNWTYSHTGSGNTASITKDGALTTLNYGADNRLSGEYTSSFYEGYTYGIEGERTTKGQGGVSTWTSFIHDQDGHLIAEAATGTASTAEYIYLEGTPVGIYDVAKHKLYSVHTDRLGTPFQVNDKAKAPQWSMTVRPYGAAQSLSNPGNITQNLRLPGQEYDSEFGSYHNGWRDFSPGNEVDPLPMYHEVDPIGVDGGINPYRYGNANPVRYVDRLGLSSTEDLVNQFFDGYQTSLAANIPSPGEVGLYNLIDRGPSRQSFAEYYNFAGDWITGLAAASAQRAATRRFAIPFLVAGTTCKIIGALLENNPQKAGFDLVLDSGAHLLHLDEIADVVKPMVLR